MAGKPLRLLCVGRLKTPCWREAANHYLQRLGRWRRVDVCEVRDGEAALAPIERAAREGARLLDALNARDTAIALDERGDMPDSPGLAALLRRLDQEAGAPCFIVGGPFGLAPEVRARARFRISLSALTWPHELARVLLLEQLYRAECILRNIPYHH